MVNVNVVYELRDRLEAAAIAGAGLMGEDFRLKRAVEQMEPLSKASPVFARIYQMGCRLTDGQANAEDKGALLLDMLALMDAVLRTQGGLLKIDRWEAMEHFERVGRVTSNIPYSALAPILEAFQGTGGGRYGVIRNAHEEHPELFDDYRIKGEMVNALGDSYGELADLVMEWLKEDGKAVIPLLKKGFDPGGKQGMARRIQIIEAIGGGEENEFYLKALKNAGKQVKEAAIRALRHDMGNEKLLLDLIKSEKGNAKEEACFSLACMEGEEAAGYWKKQMDKKPEKWAGYLVNSPAPWASDLIADHVSRWLNAWEASGVLWKDLKKEDQEALISLWNAAQGKHSPKLCACYERIYKVEPAMAADTLKKSIKRQVHPRLRQVAEDMYKAHGDKFLGCVFWADLLDDQPERLFDRFGDYVKPDEGRGILKRIAGKKPDPREIFDVLAHVKYDEETGKYVVCQTPANGYTGYGKPIKVLEHGLDLRWYKFLLDNKNRFGLEWKRSYHSYGGHANGYDVMLEGLFRPDKEDVKQAYGEYFYWNARMRGTNAADIRMLKRCGWTDYKGLLVYVGKAEKNQIVYRTRQVLEQLPLSNEEMAVELSGLVEELKKKAVNGVGILEKWVEELRNGASVEELRQMYR